MSNLPEHRRAIHGRTFDRIWYPDDYDPISTDQAVHGAMRFVLRFAATLGAAMLAFHVIVRFL